MYVAKGLSCGLFSSNITVPLSQKIPFALEVQIQAEIEYSIKTAAKYGTGKKNAEFRLFGSPLTLNADFKMIQDDKPDATDETPAPVRQDITDGDVRPFKIH